MSEVISIFISSIFMVLTTYIFGYIISNKNYHSINKIKVLIILIISATIHTIVFMYLTGMAKTLILCLLYSLILKESFEFEYSKSIFFSIIFSLLMIIPDLITLGSVIYIFDISKEVCYSSLSGSLICNAITCILYVLIMIVAKNYLRKLNDFDISTNKKIIIISSLTLISLAIFFYNLIKVFEFSNGVIGYLIVIITLIYILFYLFKQRIDNDVILKRYDELLDIMKRYENDVEEQRTLIHETKNELMTIKCKIIDKEKEQVIVKYIDNILGDKESANMSKYSKFKYLPSNGIKGFFYYKFIEAEKCQIKVSVNISEKIEKSFLGKLDTATFKDLVRIIGVYLDNAIEASSNSDDKQLGIEIYLLNNEVHIIISNTFSNNINTDKIGKERYSTKGKNRGHGLLLVKRILHESSKFKTQNKVIDNLYIQELTVMNNKDK